MAGSAKGINKQTIIAKQTALGSPASGAGGQILRRRTSVFKLERDTFENDEIVSHQQSTGSQYGMKKASGKINGLLSPGTYKLPIAGLLRAAFAGTATTGPIITVTAAATSPQFTRSGGSFITDGFRVWDIIRWTGWTVATGNNSRNFLITALTATQMTGVFLDGTAVTAKAAGDSVTGSIVGKKCMPPMTGHTNDYFTVEEWYPDVSQSEQFPDEQVGQIQFQLPATGNCQIDIDMVGLDRKLNVTQQFTTPTAETTTPVMTAVNGVLYINGVAVANVTGLQFTASGGVQQDGPVVGSNVAPDVSRSVIKVSGQFTAQFLDASVMTLFQNETNTSLFAVATTDNTATADFVSFRFTRIKVHGDAPDDGMKGIVRTYPFTAEIDINGAAGTNTDETIMVVQDSQA